MASRNLEDLYQPVAERAKLFLECCAIDGIDVLITATYRSTEEQARLYAQGRTTPGTRVTNARPGDSFHNVRRAFDFVPLIQGKLSWHDRALFERIGLIGESAGLEWGGRWKGLKDRPHFQYCACSVHGFHKLASAFRSDGTCQVGA